MSVIKIESYKGKDIFLEGNLYFVLLEKGKYASECLCNNEKQKWNHEINKCQQSLKALHYNIDDEI